MTTTNFVSGTVIDAAWLNDVDEAVYNGLPATQSFYTPAGTGAVATTVQAKLRESVSVLDFGADPTGVADSSTAIQAALNETLSVLLPPGTYLLTVPITLNVNNTLTGLGATLKKGATMVGAMITSTATNVALESFAIDGNYTVQATQVPTVHFSGSSKVRVNNLLCANLGSNVYVGDCGAIQLTNCVDAIFSKNYISNTWGMNAVFVTGASSKNVTIEDNYIVDTISDSPISTATAPYCSIINNYVEGAPGSLISHNGPYGNVSGNTCVATATMISASYNGITVGHATAPYIADFSSVTNNKIVMNGYGGSGIAVVNSSKVVVANNHISTSAGALAFPAGSYGVITNGTNIIIDSNEIIGFASGILTDSASAYATINGNNIYGANLASYFGIETTAANAFVSNNIINSFTRGVKLGGASSTFIGNNLDGFTQYGLYIALSANHFAVTSNILNGGAVSASAVYLNGSTSGSFIGNSITVTSGTVWDGTGFVDGTTFIRSNCIAGTSGEVAVTLGAGAGPQTVTNVNIVPGAAISLVSTDANFNARNVYVSSVSAGSLVLGYIAGTASSCKIVIL